MEPGDLYWFNDPYFTDGAIQHLGDMCFVAPVFAEGRVAAFAATYGHFRDIGGARPGSISPAATEIFHEGIRSRRSGSCGPACSTTRRTG